MSDLKQYIEKRQQTDTGFAEGFESGYSSFKIGVVLAQARVEAGMTQEELASLLKLPKSTISRIENHGSDLARSTLERYAEAFGKKLCVEIR